jgi:hypothetical protein
VTAGLGSIDAFGIYGSDAVVEINGTRDDVWIGLNGQNASAANLDAISFVNAGGLNLLANSAVAASGNRVKATLAGSDR